MNCSKLLPYAHIFILIFFLNNQVAFSARNLGPKIDIKILVLIIASDNHPVYIGFQKIWRSYMHYDKNHVEAYFIKGDPSLSETYKIQADILWSKTPENVIPGILNKTILSLEAMLPRLEEFDYVLRTNLSSFYIFPRLLRFLDGCPSEKFYCAVQGRLRNLNYGSGSGFLLSRDLVRLMIANKKFFLNNRSTYDDVVIGQFFQKMNIKLQPHDRVDFYSLDSWAPNKIFTASNIFQVRVKNSKEDRRLIEDIFIHSQLKKIFYGE